MDSHDANDFFKFVMAGPNIALLINGQSCVNKSVTSILPDNPDEFVFFWNKSISPQPEYKYNERHKYFLVESTISEVIEFSRSDGMSHKKLGCGRLWIETSFYDVDGNLIRKSDDFIKWYESLTKWIKKFAATKIQGAYIMPSALQYFQEQR